MLVIIAISPYTRKGKETLFRNSYVRVSCSLLHPERVDISLNHSVIEHENAKREACEGLGAERSEAREPR